MSKHLVILIALYCNTMALSSYQKEVIDIIYSEARKYTEYPSTIVGQAGVESSWGKHLVGDLNNGDNVTASLGVLQIQVKTVKWLAGKIPALAKEINGQTDYHIAIRLLKDIRFSTRVAVHHLHYYLPKKGWWKSLSIYNGGWNNKTYVNKVKKYMEVYKND